jgi:hypothetical protein
VDKGPLFQFTLGDFVSLETLRDAIMSGLNPIIRRPHIGSGETIEAVELAASVPQNVSHKLARNPVGWCVVETGDYATIRCPAWDESTITFVSDADCTINVEVW